MKMSGYCSSLQERILMIPPNAFDHRDAIQALPIEVALRLLVSVFVIVALSPRYTDTIVGEEAMLKREELVPDSRHIVSGTNVCSY
ncbi:hypothetical protein STEG23_006220 [Scotinomys teguina]